MTTKQRDVQSALEKLLGETNEALAACQSEGAGWKRRAEELERLADQFDSGIRWAADAQTALAAAKAENAALRARVAALGANIKRRRTELRRLNKYLGPYWAGFRKGMDLEGECRLRGVMNAAFGHEKVHAAEQAAIDAAIKGEKP